MAQNKSSFVVGRTKTGRGTGKPRAYKFTRDTSKIMSDEIVKALRDEYVPQMREAYDALTHGWNKSPTLTILVTPVHKGTMFRWSMDKSSNANKRWLMVDVLGRRGGKKITPGKTETVIKQAIKGAGRGERLYTTKTTERIGELKPMPMRPYTPWFDSSGNPGGAKEYGDATAFRWSVRLGAVEPKAITENNIYTAMRGEGSIVSGILEPFDNAARRGYRRAVAEITGRPQV